MNITEGYEVKKAVSYQKKCRYCGSIAVVPYKLMNFNGPTFVKCACGHEVQFTDDIGRCPSDVAFIYEKEDKQNG